jgi:DNA-binding MarR family transcriptional regulator
MATIAHKVDKLIHQRPGITREQIRRMLGTDADRALRRLVQIGYIRRVRSKSSRCYFYPIEGPRDSQ